MAASAQCVLVSVSRPRTAPRSVLSPFPRSEFMGGRSRLQLAARAVGNRQTPRARLLVEANELNKWGDTDGREEDTEPGMDDDGFDRDTAAVLARVLTARATQRVLMHLQEVDLYSGQWLSEFCSANPPLQGNKFLRKLFAERVSNVTDKMNKVTHFINPANLAHRILLLREDMARTAPKHLPAYVERDNVDLLRAHLESSSYTSGSHAKQLRPKSKRG